MSLSSGQIADLCIFIFCIVAFIVYHLYYFLSHGRYLHFGQVEHINIWKTSLKTRHLWSEVMMADGKEGINAVQTIRNMIISVSLLAAAETTLMSQLLNILTDPSRLAQLETFSKDDPISNGASIMSPQVKVALSLGILFLSFLLFAQCVRISVHLGFLIRVIPAHPNINLPLRDVTIILMQRTSLYFTLGLRLLYAFVPAAFYMTLGTTALLISTVLLLVALYLLDQVPARHVKHLLDRANTENINGDDVEMSTMVDSGNIRSRFSLSESWNAAV